MLGFGVKRKLDAALDADADDDGCRGVLSSAARHRTLLAVSLGKLHGPRTGAELGLQRRVLISNIVRRLHAELRQDATHAAALFFFSAPASPSATATNEEESFRLPPPPPASSFSLLSSPLSGRPAPDSCLAPDALLEHDLPAFFTPTPREKSMLGFGGKWKLDAADDALDADGALRQDDATDATDATALFFFTPSSPKDSFSSALEDIDELCPSTPPPLLPLRRASGVPEEGRGLQEKAPPPPLAGCFLTDFALDDGLFTDIDTSMYDHAAASVAPPGKPAPVAVTTDDLVRSLSAGYALGGAAQTQPFKMDLAELDQIMEVLVGS